MKKLTILSLFLVISNISFCQIFYSDQAISLGISHSYQNGINGGGVSLCDFDQDGWDDISLATGPGENLKFYKNNNGTFELLTTLVNYDAMAHQILWVDFDNDGDKDLYITSYEDSNRLYENLGDLRLIDITEKAKLPLNKGRSFGACFGDYNRDGWLDLYYSDRKGPENAILNECRLFKNEKNGQFIEVTSEAGVADLSKKPYCSAFLDYNLDGWPDIYTAQDKRTINSLFANGADNTFTNVAYSTNSALSMFAMCVNVGDFDNDGWQDIYITNTVGNALLHNRGNETEAEFVFFNEIAEEKGVGFHGFGWASNFLDADNDGDLDLYVSGSLKGTYDISSLFYENNGTGNFSVPDAGFEGDTLRSFSNAIGDFNKDGFTDIFVVNQSPDMSQCWLATKNSNNWVKIFLEGVLSNRDGIGSKIDVFIEGKKQQRYTQCGSGFLGQNSNTKIIGIGKIEIIDSILVSWSSGHVDKLYNLSANQTLKIKEGSTNNGIINVADDVNILTTATHDHSTNNNSTIKIFPNPASTNLNINYSDKSVQNAFIYDSNGIMKQKFKIQNGEYELDVSDYPVGLYFMIVQKKNKPISIAKFIII